MKEPAEVKELSQMVITIQRRSCWKLQMMALPVVTLT